MSFVIYVNHPLASLGAWAPWCSGGRSELGGAGDWVWQVLSVVAAEAGGLSVTKAVEWQREKGGAGGRGSWTRSCHSKEGTAMGSSAQAVGETEGPQEARQQSRHSEGRWAVPGANGQSIYSTHERLFSPLACTFKTMLESRNTGEYNRAALSALGGYSRRYGGQCKNRTELWPTAK